MSNSELALSDGTVSHWVLFGLAWAEEHGKTPIRKDTLYEEMGADAFNEQSIDQKFPALHQSGLVYRTPTRPIQYTLSEDGKDELLSLGPPDSIPTHGYTGTLNRALELPDSVHERQPVPQKLRVDSDWPDDAHLFQEHPQTGELQPLCETPVSAPSFSMSITPADIDTHDVCSACTDRRVFTQWRENYAPEDDSADASVRDDNRWDRYQTWINEHEFDSESVPDRALDEGKIVVSSEYTDAPHPRKLHAYQRFEDDDNEASDWFTPLCGHAVGNQHVDQLESMDPDAFLFRSESCNWCKRLIRAADDFESSGSSAEQVDFDPFGVFDDGDDATAETADTVSRDSETQDEPDHVCPDCGRTFDTGKGLTIHWGHPKSGCEYPVPDTDEREVFTGLWLVGGERDGVNAPPMRKSSVNRAALEWVNDQLGIWSGTVKESNSDDEQRANVESGFDYEDADSQTQYRLTTRACPWLDELAERNIADIELTPRIARILYSFRGHTIDNSAISLRHKHGPELKACLENAGFEVRSLADPADGKNQYRVTLSASASRDFADLMGDPLPGFENKAIDFRESHTHKEGSRTSEPSSEQTVPDTISLEPNWEWVGVQLYKLGLKPFAVRAFNAEMSPAEIYGDGGVQDIIYEAAQDDTDYGLDLGSPGSRTVTLVEQPVSEIEAAHIRQDLGLDDDPDNGNGGSNEATA